MIINPDKRKQTEKQLTNALSVEEMPRCVGNPGLPCPHAATDFVIMGYDGKYRCNACNKIHVELVMKEAGESSPNSLPQFVEPKLDARANNERQARMDALYNKLEGAGHIGRPSNNISVVESIPGDYKDMKDAMSRDEFRTRDRNIDAEERRQRILAKYSKGKR